VALFQRIIYFFGCEVCEDVRKLVETATLAGAVIGSGKPFSQRRVAIEKTISDRQRASCAAVPPEGCKRRVLSRRSAAGDLLQGSGKFMRPVKLRPGTATNASALSELIDSAYSDIKVRIENG